jgi:hypothetical protein
MKIKNPAIIAAIRKAAHTLNVTPDEILDYVLGNTAERIETDPVDVLTDLAHFRYDTAAQARTAAERLEEVATSEALEGRTHFSICCEVVEDQDGFRLEVNQLHPNGGKWCLSSGPGPAPEARDETEEDDRADWWKESD